MSDPLEPVFGALSDPTRRQVIERLASAGSLTPTEIASELPVTRQAVSKHLNALSDAGLVASERSGREIRYTLTPHPMSHVVTWLADIGAEWDERLAALREHLSQHEQQVGHQD
jgi:DNA-binding transcriptional ArsR family regulator